MKKISFLPILIMSSIGFGQWTDDYSTNTLVAEGPTSDVISSGTIEGNTFVVFWDEADGYDLRVQLLDVDGNRVFGDNGMLVNDVADNSTWTATRSQAVNEDGYLIVGFTATNDGNGYVNKISPTGEQLFGASGITIPNAWDLKVLPLFDGGVVVGWYEDGIGKLMKYDSSGNPSWDSVYSFDSPDSGRPYTGAGELAYLSDGSIIAIFHTKPTSWSVDSIPYAQKFTAEGEPVWETPVQISTQSLMSNRRYQITQDQDVVYFAYHGSTGTRFDSFVQRINADGTLPWGADGSDFSLDENFMEMTTTMSIEPESDFIWAAANITNLGQSPYGQSVQKFNKETGEVQLGTFAKMIFPVDDQNWISVGDLQIVDGQPFFLFSNGISNGVNPIQLGVVLLDENGEFVWEEEHIMIATTPGNKYRYDFTRNVQGQSVAVWAEERDGVYKSYAQNFVVDIEIAGVQDQNDLEISIFPNPTTGFLTLQSQKEIEKIEVFSMSGQLILTQGYSKNIDVSHLKQGVYVLKATFANGAIKTTKLLKK